MDEDGAAGAAEGKIYELGYNLLPTIPADRVAAEVTAIKDALGAGGAVVIAEEFPKVRRLAYAMRKLISGQYHDFDTAHFGWIKFEFPPEAIPALEKALKGRETLIRFILMKTVRESTLSVPKPPLYRPADRTPKKDAKPGAEVPPPAPVSEAELDKSIEALIAE